MEVGTIIRYDVFTTTQGKGNPVGIIYDGDHYTDKEKQEIAYKVGFNECCFVCKSKVADYRLRYYTPGHETPLCGHATIGTMYHIIDQMNLSESKSFQIETLAGILSIQYDFRSKEIKMEQSPAQFREFHGDIDELMKAIGLTIDDYNDKYPICFGSTGSWTTIVPVKTLEAFKRMTPDNKRFPNILAENERASVHPFTFSCFDNQYQLHGRHFSSPFSGTIEDSVTGTASGVMAAYYLKYVEPKEEVELLIEQGNEIGKEGYVRAFAEVNGNEINVSISGKAVKGKTIEWR